MNRCIPRRRWGARNSQKVHIGTSSSSRKTRIMPSVQLQMQFESLSFSVYVEGVWGMIWAQFEVGATWSWGFKRGSNIESAYGPDHSKVSTVNECG
jgi:hypothetical protein